MCLIHPRPTGLIHPRPGVSHISETWCVLFIRDLMCLIRLRSGVPYPPPYRLIHRPPVQIAPSGCADCPTRPCGLCGSCRSGSCLERLILCRSRRLCGSSRLSSCFKSSREGSSNRNDRFRSLNPCKSAPALRGPTIS